MASALSDLSTTALSNGTKLGQQMAENATPPSSVNNAVRGWQAYLAQWMQDNNGSVSASGTTTITATLNQGFTAYGAGDGQIKNGERIAIKMPSASSGATTLNVNGLGAKAIRRPGDRAINTGDWPANATILLRYDTAYNSAAGAWVLLGTQTWDDVAVGETAIASAATLDLTVASTPYINITGTTGVTAVTMTATQVRFARIVSAGLLFTASSTLIVNGSTSGSYMSTANDLLMFEGYSASTVRVWVISAPGTLVGPNVASAATLNLQTSMAGMVTITGTTTVTLVSLGENRTKWALAAGVFSITAGALLSVNGSTAGGYTTTAGDLLLFIGGTGGLSASVYVVSSTAFSAGFTGTGAIVRQTSPTLNTPAVSGLLDLSNTGQVKFASTPVPSADANTLDDYDESTWTPVLQLGGGTTGITYATQVARATKIGRFALEEIRIVLTSKGSSTGNVNITGSAYATSQRAGGAIGQYSNFSGLTGALMLTKTTGATNYALAQHGAAASSVLTDTSLTNTTDFAVSAAFSV